MTTRPVKTCAALLSVICALSFCEALSAQEIAPAGKVLTPPKPDDPQARRLKRRVKGLEWMQMPASERVETILASVAVLAQRGHTADGTLNEYYDAVSEKLSLNPSLYDQDVTAILESILRQQTTDNPPVAS